MLNLLLLKKAIDKENKVLIVILILFGVGISLAADWKIGIIVSEIKTQIMNLLL